MSPVELADQRSGEMKQMQRKGRVSVYQVDAFTETPLSGNPAGVVPDADGLTDEEMGRIAREMAVPETAFVLSPTVPEADFRIRWFTPQTEVQLCGHATIASFHVLAQERLHGMKAPGTYRFRVETKTGVLPVTVTKNRGTIDLMFGLPVPEFIRAGQYKLDAIRLLNIKLDQVENRMPVVATDYLFVPVRRLHTIFDLRPNVSGMKQFLSNRNLTGICVFTTETVDRTSAFHSRFFAPPVGIDEDPVTGTANGPLGAYLVEFGKMSREGEVTMIGEQGDVIGRRGRVMVSLSVHDRKVTSLAVGGRAVIVLKGEMLLG